MASPVTDFESSSQSWSEVLANIFRDIKTRKKETRVDGAARLRQYVAEQTHEMKGEFFTHFMHDINEYIKDLTKSSAAQDVLGGIMALDKLLDVEYDLNDGIFVTQWAAYLRTALHQSENIQVVTEASRCLGRLARIYQHTMPREFIDFEIRQALEWLLSGHHFRATTAVCVLAELLQNVPTLINVEHVESFVDLMWLPLRDNDITLREGTVEVLRWSLKVVKDRSRELRLNLYKKVYALAENGFKVSKLPDSIHGSMLVFGEVLADNCEYLNDKYEEVSKMILSMRDHKNQLIRHTVIQLIPQLAKFNPQHFADQNLSTCTEHLLASLSNKKERGAVLLALGEMGLVLKERINSVLGSIINIITQAFTARFGKNLLCPELFRCISMLSIALGGDLAIHMKPILPQMFATEFSQILIDTLSDIANNIPSLRDTIQERLLNVLSMYLTTKDSGRALHRQSIITPNTSNTSSSLSSPRDSVVMSPATPGPNNMLNLLPASLAGDRTPMIILSLHTLATFEFDTSVTRDLVHKLVVHYLDDENATIRKKAAIACTKLLISKNERPSMRGPSASIIADVLMMLLRVVLTDMDPSIRESILGSLDERYDLMLSQPEFIKTIFLFLYDEVFEIRELAVLMLGRLSVINPAYIFPSLRSYLVDVVKEIEASEDIHKKESSAKLFGKVIRSLSKLVKPYTDTLVKQLLGVIRQEQSSRLSSYGLAALGDLAEVAGDTMLQYMDELMPLVIENFQEQSSSTKRYVALKTLDSLVENTGYVIEPFLKYPRLLDTILNKIKREDQATTRSQLIRLLGTMGALDPYKYKQLQLEQLEDIEEAANSSSVKPSTSGSNGNGKENGAGQAQVQQQQGPELNASGDASDSDLMRGVSLASEDYYPSIALTILLQFLRKPYGALATLQPMVIQAVMTIFKSQGLKCVPYLKHFMPLFMHVMKVVGESMPGLRELMFQQLCILVSIIKHYTRDFLDEFFGMIKEYWDNPILSTQIILLIEEIADALNDEIGDALVWMMPKMLRVLANDSSPNNQATLRIFHAFESFGTLLDDYMHLIIPAIMRLIDNPQNPGDVRKAALFTLGKLSQKHSLTKYATAIMLPLARVLDQGSPSIQNQVLETLYDIVISFEQEFKVFIPMIQAVVNKRQIHNTRYNNAIYKLVSNEPLPLPELYANHKRKKSTSRLDEMIESGSVNINPKAGNVNSQVLAQAWDTTKCFTKSDWFEWIRKLSITLLAESPSAALRCMAPLAMSHQPVARQLFNAGFVSCWGQLSAELRDNLVKCIEQALSSANIPPEILQILLDLAEFMEHNEKALPIDIKILASLAVKCQAYAKALHYKESEFRQNPQSTIEQLIYINNELHQLEAAQGLLKYAREQLQVPIKTTWYEKVQRWTAALEQYDKQQADFPDDLNIMLGRMRCMASLSDWEGVSNLVDTALKRTDLTPVQRTEVATISLSSALNLMRWEKMDECITYLDENLLDAAFYRAIIAVHHGEYNESQRLIDKARELAATELTALLGESYNRAYDVVVRIQQLTELEEVVTYKKLSNDLDKRELLRKLWRKRLEGVERNVEVWQAILAVRSLVVPPTADPETWIKFANLVRKSARPRKARKILTQLLVGAGKDLKFTDPIPDTSPMVKYSYLKVLYANPDETIKKSAYEEMERWAARFEGFFKQYQEVKARQINDNFLQFKTQSMPVIPRGELESSIDGFGGDDTDLDSSGEFESSSREPSTPTRPPLSRQASFSTAAYASMDGGFEMEDGPIRPETPRKDNEQTDVADILMYQARSLSKLAQWQLAANENNLDEALLNSVLVRCKGAIDRDSEWYKGWHMWAFVHYRAVSYLEKQNKNHPKLDQHLLPAVTGFIRSVALAPYDNLQDTLRLLTLWFKYGARKDIEKAVNDGFDTLNVDTWLGVIPQLMARIHIPVRSVRHGIHKLLTALGKKHPQALVFPLIVAAKSPYPNRVAAAQSIIATLRPHSPRLIDQTLLVANELIRVAILWKEKWAKGIEEAYRYYFGNKNPDSMMQVLQPLHAMLEQPPETQHEKALVKTFGKDLERAWNNCKEFMRTGKVACINTAWDLYGHVLRTIKKQLSTDFDKLHLQTVSPKLLEVHDLDLAVPGTYKVNKPIIRIKSFNPIFKVIPSKQQPRKLVIDGSNGQIYPYLLKAHEDLRQDERVMQLFGLVNTFLALDDLTAKNHLDIRQYSVIPLSHDTGLIEWVPHSDTLHELLKDYRKTHNLPIEAEHTYMQRFCTTPEYYKLTVFQKLEVLQYALERTPGNDLERIVWLGSHNSEEWLDKRTTYTRSLAVMSMVGYILGLGDRHPNNLMINRNTGKVVHIDFGDCFEVAMHRDKFAEKVPFRLTRMLVNAMEVSGIEGNFRTTCEAVMKVMRENKESMMAVLEAFVYDPLINWRLITNPSSGPSEMDDKDNMSPMSDEDDSDISPVARPINSLSQSYDHVQHSETPDMRDQLNQRALNVIERVSNKLSGRDFPRKGTLDVAQQVDLLIKQATSTENLCQAYLGWCPYW